MWTKLDDGILDHPKIAQVGTVGFAWFVAGLVYCNRNLTDGFIPYTIARRLLTQQHADFDGKLWTVALMSGMAGQDLDEATEMIIGWLLDAGLWEMEPGGYRVHDFTDYNFTKEQVLGLRQVRAEAGSRGGIASAQAKAKQRLEQELQQASSIGSSKTEAKFNPAPAPAPAPETEPRNKNGVSEEALKLASKYLDPLRSSSPKVFKELTPELALEIASDEGLSPLAAARMLGDVRDWWDRAPPSKRWKFGTRGWRVWCRREANKAAEEEPSPNGQGPQIPHIEAPPTDWDWIIENIGFDPRKVEEVHEPGLD